MLYLESLGNPRKFSRIARRLARQKPVVVVKSGRFRGDAPAGHLVRESRAPAAAVDALFRRAGVIRAESIHQMFDVAALVATQPLPAGPPGGACSATPTRSRCSPRTPARRPGSRSWARHAARRRTPTRPSSPTALDEVFADDGVDSVVALFIPPLRTRDTEVAEVLAAASRRAEQDRGLDVPRHARRAGRAARPRRRPRVGAVVLHARGRRDARWPR